MRRKPLRKRARLGEPELGERAVQLSLVSILGIPLRFSVAQDDEARGRHVLITPGKSGNVERYSMRRRKKRIIELVVKFVMLKTSPVPPNV